MVRALLPRDIYSVLEIQRESYPDSMNESQSTIQLRLQQAPLYSWVFEHGSEVLAYLIAYPSVKDKITALGADFDIPSQPDCLYLHDLAVSKRAVGMGVGKQLIAAAWRFGLEQRLASSALVSVQNSCAFWEKFGYGVQENLNANARLNLASYPNEALYMVKHFD